MYIGTVCLRILGPHSIWDRLPSSLANKTVAGSNRSCISSASFWIQIITLAAHGLEELFFQLCCCVSFSVVAGNSFRCYLPAIPVVPLCFFLVAAGNSFGFHRSVFWLWREIILGVTYLSTIPVVPLCQFFGCGGK